MAETAFQIQYRQQFIDGFEVRSSLLRDSVTTEATIKGNTATFLVADSGGATAKTRGTNGLIPARADNLTQPTATLVEQHDLVRKTGFNIFASQGNQVEIMQRTSMGVINRRVDSDIITILDTATNDTGASATASLDMVVHALTILGNNDVPLDGQVWAAITPAFLGYLMKTKEFGSADYVTRRPLDGDNPGFDNQPGFYDWMNVKWVVHPALTGVGTTTEDCYMYHRSAVGHAINVGDIDAMVGRDEEQDYSWARSTYYGGGSLLQNSGIVNMNHDGSGFAAS